VVDLSSHNTNPPGVFDGAAVPLFDVADTGIEASNRGSSEDRRRARLAPDRRELDRGRNAAVWEDNPAPILASR
jgi:hypothetical protein